MGKLHKRAKNGIFTIASKDVMRYKHTAISTVVFIIISSLISVNWIYISKY